MYQYETINVKNNIVNIETLDELSDKENNKHNKIIINRISKHGEDLELNDSFHKKKSLQ